MNTNKGSVVKQSSNDVEGCRSRKVLFQPNMSAFLQYSDDNPTNDDPIKMSYHEMLKYQAERNWVNNVHELRDMYNLPPNDENVCNLTYAMWKKWYMIG